jgi:hypothetical protein
MTNFAIFSKLVHEAFQGIAKCDGVFTTAVTGDDLYAEYLAAFPESDHIALHNRAAAVPLPAH